MNINILKQRSDVLTHTHTHTHIHTHTHTGIAIASEGALLRFTL